MGFALTELFGRLLGIGFGYQLTSHGIDITHECADVSITVGAEVTNVIPITVQFKKADGSDMDSVVVADFFIFGDASGLSGGAGGSTGLAVGTDGALIATPEAKKYLIFSSEADGDLDLTFTDTGTTAFYVGCRLPTGRLVISSVVQMA